MSKNIPVYGSMKRPANPKQGLKEIQKGLIDWNGCEIVVRFETNEFTSICPKTGQPDFSTIIIEYIPNDKYIESKTLKFYLWSFRQYGGHCEKLAKKVVYDLNTVVNPKYIQCTLVQNPRGGIKLTSTCSLGKKDV